MARILNNTHYLIVGNGRVARHFSDYIQKLEIPFDHWKFSREFNDDFYKLCERATHALILTTDSAIEELATKILKNIKTKPPLLLHCSGALVTDLAVSVHPLFPFPTDELTLEELQCIPFVIEDRGYVFSELLPGFENAHFVLPSTDKPLYHAYCVMLGNFTTLLWQSIVQKMYADLRIPKDFAFQYLQQIMRNFIKDPRHALTGPLVRGDSVTLEKNLNALHEQKTLEQLYRDFVHLYFESPRKDLTL